MSSASIPSFDGASTCLPSTITRYWRIPSGALSSARTLPSGLEIVMGLAACVWPANAESGPAAPSRIAVANLEMLFTILPSLGAAFSSGPTLVHLWVKAECLQRALHELNSWHRLASADADLELRLRYVIMCQREPHLAAFACLQM